MFGDYFGRIFVLWRLRVVLCALYSIGFIPLWAVETPFLHDYDIVRSKVSTYSVEEGLSLMDSLAAFSRNGDVSAGEISENTDTLDFVSPVVDESMSDYGIEGQFAYDDSGVVIFSKGGVLYYGERTSSGKWKNARALRIEGVGKSRVTMRGSSMFYRSWRYPVKNEVVMYNPHLSKDKQNLYYSSNMEGTLGGLDIWVSRRMKGNRDWEKPVNLGDNINTVDNEDYPFIAGSSFYFSSDRKDTLKGFNIYKCSTLESSAKLIPEPINSHSDDYNFIGNDRSIFLISNRDGNVDVYCPSKRMKTEVDSLLDGGVSDSAKVDSDSIPVPTEPVASHLPDDDKIPTVAMPDVNTCILYFIFDQDNFITDYSAEIDTILKFIDFHKGAKFDVVGHTDERGTVEYNQGLSERRADKLYQILIRRGVAAERLNPYGRSELDLAIPNAKTRREHQLNRRVVIRKKD